MNPMTRRRRAIQAKLLMGLKKKIIVPMLSDFDLEKSGMSVRARNDLLKLFKGKNDIPLKSLTYDILDNTSLGARNIMEILSWKESVLGG